MRLLHTLLVVVIVFSHISARNLKRFKKPVRGRAGREGDCVSCDSTNTSKPANPWGDIWGAGAVPDDPVPEPLEEGGFTNGGWASAAGSEASSNGGWTSDSTGASGGTSDENEDSGTSDGWTPDNTGSSGTTSGWTSDNNGTSGGVSDESEESGTSDEWKPDNTGSSGTPGGWTSDNTGSSGTSGGWTSDNTGDSGTSGGWTSDNNGGIETPAAGGDLGQPCTCMSVLECGGSLRAGVGDDSKENVCPIDGDVCCMLASTGKPSELLPQGEGSLLRCGEARLVPPSIPLSGTQAQFGELPWTVLISNNRGVTDETGAIKHNICAGSLVHARAVVTAAHCVSKCPLNGRSQCAGYATL